MKRWWVAIGFGLLAATAAAQNAPVAKAAPSEHVRNDIARHRAMAAAHEAAAKCLESGKSEKECHAPLATECKAVAIGKYCGMRHRH